MDSIILPAGAAEDSPVLAPGEDFELAEQTAELIQPHDRQSLDEPHILQNSVSLMAVLSKRLGQWQLTNLGEL